MQRTDLEKLLFGGIFFIANKLETVADRYLARYGLSVKQWMITLVIEEMGDFSPTLSEVSERIGTTRQNVKQIALKLEQKGFVEICRDTTDKRILRLSLTPKCRDFWNTTDEWHLQFICGLFDCLSDAAIETTFEALKTLHDQKLTKTEGE